jgi:soluble lytic murein transglycosylase-like protein
LEKENEAKDATIEKLKKENKLLEEKLSFNRKIDDLVAEVKKEASWLDYRIIRPAAEKALAYTTDPALYLAIGLVEAGFQADVVHTDGVALGMHGLCPKDWHSYLKRKGIMESRDDYFDPVKSFKGSEAVLSALVREFGSLEKALLYYNGGGLAAAGRIPQSKVYAKRVLHLRSVFAASLQGHSGNEKI